MNRSKTITPPPSKRRKITQTPLPGVHSAGTEYAIPKTGHKTLRLFSWNINGISPFLQKPISSFFTPLKSITPPSNHTGPRNPAASASLRDFLRRHDWPDILFLQEVKIKATDTPSQLAVHKAVNPPLSVSNCGPRYLTFFTLPTDLHNARGFGGRLYGVCTLIQEPFYEAYVDSVHSVPWDLEGRMSVVKLRNRMALFNIYAVNGTSAPYRSPETGEVLGTRHDRKRVFHKLLADECRKLHDAGWTVVVAGDLNVAPGRIDGHPNLRTFPEEHVANRADFHERLLTTGVNALGLVDVWRRRNEGVKKFTYHPWSVKWGFSCDRVDLVLVSKQLLEKDDVVGAEIWDSRQERGTSDHVPISVELRLVGMEDENIGKVGP